MLQLASGNAAGCWHNAWMTALSLALANLKPGTGKTTSAVWLAHVFVQAGNRVLLVDADPSGSALEWSDLAAMDARLGAQQAFRFRVVALPSRELHRRLPEIARDDDVVIIDTPQTGGPHGDCPVGPAVRRRDRDPVRAQPDRDQPHYAGAGGDR